MAGGMILLLVLVGGSCLLSPLLERLPKHTMDKLLHRFSFD